MKPLPGLRSGSGRPGAAGRGRRRAGDHSGRGRMSIQGVTLADGRELDLRSIKVVLQMDLLRCKTPELVRKEVWAHVLAYNLIRTVMAQAAAERHAEPRSISFTATLQVLEAFRPLIAFQGHRGAAHLVALYQQILRAIAVHRVADRPDRFEPRMAKRRPKRYDCLTRPRHEIKRQMLKRLR